MSASTPRRLEFSLFFPSSGDKFTTAPFPSFAGPRPLSAPLMSSPFGSASFVWATPLFCGPPPVSPLSFAWPPRGSPTPELVPREPLHSFKLRCCSFLPPPAAAAPLLQGFSQRTLLVSRSSLLTSRILPPRSNLSAIVLQGKMKY